MGAGLILAPPLPDRLPTIRVRALPLVVMCESPTILTALPRFDFTNTPQPLTRSVVPFICNEPEALGFRA